jgi:nucleoside phosphorylase
VGAEVLIVAAVEGELEALRGFERDGSWDACAVGLGLVAATIGTVLRLSKGAPRTVILVGTCGAYEGSGLSLGDVVTARRIGLIEPGAAREQVEFPERLSTNLLADGPLVDSLARAGAEPADVATTLGITVDDGLASDVARTWATQVEHLEACGVAAACERAAVAFGAVFGVANVVGSRARREWRATHRVAEANAARVLGRWLGARPK